MHSRTWRRPVRTLSTCDSEFVLKPLTHLRPSMSTSSQLSDALAIVSDPAVEDPGSSVLAQDAISARSAGRVLGMMRIR
ncbi:MAG TPA: hypothetical protein VKA54_10735 [Gemmatimonadaceae bacterium]|nr:hypothetical protein [Gemmatimonadaceae bacterium]